MKILNIFTDFHKQNYYFIIYIDNIFIDMILKKIIKIIKR